MDTKHFCPICKVVLPSAKAFILDRQKHISKGEIKKENVKSEAITK